MFQMKKNFLFGLVLATCAAPCFAEGVIRPGTMVVRSTFTEVSGTPGYKVALDFLAKRFDAGQGPVDVRLLAGESGPITVRQVRTESLAHDAPDQRPQPETGEIPQPPAGKHSEPAQPGDHQGYDLCNGSSLLTWSYENQCGDDGCDWVLTDFEMHGGASECDAAP